MKKLYFLVVILLVVGSVRGQNPDDIVVIPDAAFKNMLLNESTYFVKNSFGYFITLDINNDSEIQVSEALNVAQMYIYNKDELFSLEGIQAFRNLKRLSCTHTNITTLDVTGLNQLAYLDARINNLTSLTHGGLTSLKTLYLDYNNMSTIDLTGLPSLEELNCSNNQLTQLDVTMVPNLKILYCENNGMTSLNIAGLIKLKMLICHSNFLTELDEVALKKLSSLSCSNNLFTSLDFTESSSIQNITCRGNQLTSLLFAGSTIRDLNCQDNFLTSLDFNGVPYLKDLNCQNNLLTSLNFDGAPNLIDINCSYNQLTTLNVSSLNYLTYMDVSHNQLESLFIKNGSIQYAQNDYFSNNPNLQYICADENEISELKELSFFANTTINSYCSFTPGGTFYTISGNNTLDSDINGCDASDIALPNLKFNITNGIQTGSIIANQSGEYSLPVAAGTHTITPILENPSYYTISTTAVNVTFPTETSPFTQNFCITPNGIHPDLEVAILPTTPARPGFNAHYKIIIKNKGNIQQSGSVSLAYNDAVLDYVSVNPAFTTQAEGSLSWAFANLEPFETREINVTLNVNSPMETPAVNGDDVLTYTATITSEATDELPLDNTFSLPQIVVNSFDPNDKTCLEGTAISQSMIGQYVHYMIRFENTGTFAAENIVVKDMIDTAKFDVSSLIALNGSHPYVTRITGNKVEFIFENIHLPFDDANNDGYVVFKIKTLPTLVLGNSFSNTASIYFDYNHPIVTEPAVTTFADLDTKDFEFSNYLTIYPNPTKGILNITSKQDIEMQSISIYNVLGQMVVAVPNAKGVSNVDVSSLSTGNYFIKVVSDKGTSNSKFIKQ